MYHDHSQILDVDAAWVIQYEAPAAFLERMHTSVLVAVGTRLGHQAHTRKTVRRPREEQGWLVLIIHDAFHGHGMILAYEESVMCGILKRPTLVFRRFPLYKMGN